MNSFFIGNLLFWRKIYHFHSMVQLLCFSILVENHAELIFISFQKIALRTLLRFQLKAFLLKEHESPCYMILYKTSNGSSFLLSLLKLATKWRQLLNEDLMGFIDFSKKKWINKSWREFILLLIHQCINILMDFVNGIWIESNSTLLHALISDSQRLNYIEADTILLRAKRKSEAHSVSGELTSKSQTRLS